MKILVPFLNKIQYPHLLQRNSTDITITAAVEKSLRLLQALVQIAAGTTSSAADAKTWNMARGQFALGKLSFVPFLSLIPMAVQFALVLFLADSVYNNEE